MEKNAFFAADPVKAARLNPDEKPESDVRDGFQVDRDRILYSKAFRRLRGKTQVFIAGYDDHVRNRLSHTLEVSQIARTISNALGLNEMLTEAIALGHDLGHTPFGHVGERTLNEITMGSIEKYVDGDNYKPLEDGFKHNWQSVRVACDLEYHSREYFGLNLTKETLWGFLHHSGLECKGDGIPSFYEGLYWDILPNEKYWSFEGIVVSLADEIAQRHHDIEDGLITGILERKSLITRLKKTYQSINTDKSKALIELLDKHFDEDYPEFYYEVFAHAIVDYYVREVVANAKGLFKEIKKKYFSGRNSSKSFYERKDVIWSEYVRSEKEFAKRMMSQPLYDADDKLQKEYFMQRILLSHQAQKNDGKAAYIIRRIASAYLSNPQQMPDNAIIMLFSNCEKARNHGLEKKLIAKMFDKNKDRSDNIGEWREKLNQQLHGKRCYTKKIFRDSLLRTVIDYVAGMTDDYAIAVYEQLYGGTKKNRY